jgi:hypothetical protein
MSDVGGVDGFVETGVFYCGSDDGAAGVGAGYARDYIDAGSADDDVAKATGRVRASVLFSVRRGGGAGGR